MKIITHISPFDNTKNENLGDSLGIEIFQGKCNTLLQ